MIFNDTSSSLRDEFEGQSTEEAIKKAEKAMGLEREKMDIKIVCEEKKGLFGMRGSKLAKIKVIKKKPSIKR